MSAFHICLLSCVVIGFATGCSSRLLPTGNKPEGLMRKVEEDISNYFFFIASGVGLCPLYCGHFWPVVPYFELTHDN
jgi:hypothetical protein